MLYGSQNPVEANTEPLGDTRRLAETVAEGQSFLFFFFFSFLFQFLKQRASNMNSHGSRSVCPSQASQEKSRQHDGLCLTLKVVSRSSGAQSAAGRRFPCSCNGSEWSLGSRFDRDHHASRSSQKDSQSPGPEYLHKTLS
ncbi:hypothetical protein BO71DRAFT_249552 [Aspergillus ellipticus CBS 707.79]|uniref:Uncharacterized protein n=1 Tax=Aspergillus ellipticus CBS 707.79 TaxID=1448320 RepID=A0A319DR32_9EURO|nr:hypothetical protein BO71DRAFT_249552 [Aspergillus ellipticus CBS 707.79]